MQIPNKISQKLARTLVLTIAMANFLILFQNCSSNTFTPSGNSELLKNDLHSVPEVILPGDVIVDNTGTGGNNNGNSNGGNESNNGGDGETTPPVIPPSIPPDLGDGGGVGETPTPGNNGGGNNGGGNQVGGGNNNGGNGGDGQPGGGDQAGGGNNNGGDNSTPPSPPTNPPAGEVSLVKCLADAKGREWLRSLVQPNQVQATSIQVNHQTHLVMRLVVKGKLQNVIICQVPPGNPANAHLQAVGVSSIGRGQSVSELVSPAEFEALVDSNL